MARQIRCNIGLFDLKLLHSLLALLAALCELFPVACVISLGLCGFTVL